MTYGVPLEASPDFALPGACGCMHEACASLRCPVRDVVVLQLKSRATCLTDYLHGQLLQTLDLVRETHGHPSLLPKVRTPRRP